MTSFLIRLQRLIYRNRSLTFTPAGTRFILLTLAVGIAAVNTGNNLLYLILGMMLSLIIVSGILSEQSLRNVSVEWRFPARIFAKQPVPAEMRITNGKRFLPSFSFRVDDGGPIVSGGRPSSPALAPAEPDARFDRSVYTFKLSAGETTSASQTTRFEKRGLCALPPITLRTTFPFGFFHKTLIRTQTQTVLVYPRILPMPPGLRAAGGRIGEDHEHRRGFGTELHNLRDYTPADDARGIHWKSSARQSKLLLKEYEREEDGLAHLFLSNRIASGAPPGDRGGPTEKQREDFERAVEIAAALAREYDRRGQSVRLRTLSEEARDLDAILKTLALVQPVSDPAPDDLLQQIAALDGGHRILILPGPDPLWNKVRGRFTDVLTADEPRWIEWAREKSIPPAGRS